MYSDASITAQVRRWGLAKVTAGSGKERRGLCVVEALADCSYAVARACTLGRPVTDIERGELLTMRPTGLCRLSDACLCTK